MELEFLHLSQLNDSSILSRVKIFKIEKFVER